MTCTYHPIYRECQACGRAMDRGEERECASSGSARLTLPELQSLADTFLCSDERGARAWITDANGDRVADPAQPQPQGDGVTRGELLEALTVVGGKLDRMGAGWRWVQFTALLREQLEKAL